MSETRFEGKGILLVRAGETPSVVAFQHEAELVEYVIRQYVRRGWRDANGLCQVVAAGQFCRRTTNEEEEAIKTQIARFERVKASLSEVPVDEAEQFVRELSSDFAVEGFPSE